MAVRSEKITVSTKGETDVIDITEKLNGMVAGDGVSDGQALAFVHGSTAAIATMEFEPGGIHDLRETLDRLIPESDHYEHNRLNNDSNSHAHQRATLVGPSEAVPIVDGELALGSWQQLVLIDFDDRPRERTVVLQLVS